MSLLEKKFSNLSWMMLTVKTRWWNHTSQSIKITQNLRSKRWKQNLLDLEYVAVKRSRTESEKQTWLQKWSRIRIHDHNWENLLTIGRKVTAIAETSLDIAITDQRQNDNQLSKLINTTVDWTDSPTTYGVEVQSCNQSLLLFKSSLLVMIKAGTLDKSQRKTHSQRLSPSTPKVIDQNGLRLNLVSSERRAKENRLLRKWSERSWEKLWQKGRRKSSSTRSSKILYLTETQNDEVLLWKMGWSVQSHIKRLETSSSYHLKMHRVIQKQRNPRCWTFWTRGIEHLE